MEEIAGDLHVIEKFLGIFGRLSWPGFLEQFAQGGPIAEIVNAFAVKSICFFE